MNPNPPYIPPVLENTKDKAEPLDWESLQLGQCFLNYHSPQAVPLDAAKRTWGLLNLVTIASVPLWFVLSWSALQHITGGEFLGLTLLLGGVCAGIYSVITPAEKFREPSSWNTMLALLLMPLFLWLFILVSPWLAHPKAAVFLLALVALPLLLWLFDRQAMHAVYWMTAQPPLSLTTLMAWRRDWAKRFTGMPVRKPWRDNLSPAEQDLHRKVMKARQCYWHGFAWLALVFGVVPAAAAWLSSGLPASHIGIRVAAAVVAVLAIVGVVRNAHLPDGFGEFLRSLPNFLFHGSSGRYPPWSFHSPVGAADKRLLLFVGCYFAFNVTLLTSVNFFRWVYFNDFTVEYLPGPMVEALEGDRTQGVGFFLALLSSSPFLFSCLLLQVILCLVFPALVFLLAGYALLGPVLAAHRAALLGPAAYEPDRSQSNFDCYTYRLIESPNPTERASLFVGRHPHLDYPILLHTDLLFEHAHILGGTGTGKTALGLSTHLIQLIRRNDGAVVVIDAKGDPALFHTLRLEAKEAKRKFRWFTNKPNRSTYAFNPFDGDVLRRISLEESVGLLLNSLNLHHGDEYGRAWFSMASRILVKTAFDQTLPEGARPHSRRPRLAQGETPVRNRPLRSFRELNEVIFALLDNDSKEFEAAKHVAFLVETLADLEQLNLAPDGGPPQPAFENAIRMPRVLSDKEVVYFYLEGAMDTSTVSEIGRLAIYSLLSACIVHKDKTGKSPRAYCVFDEAQLVIAKNIENVLAQARSYGLACILSHQSMSQLNPPGGVDLRDLVMACTCVKQIFSARDPWMQKYLAEVSGRVRYATLSYDQSYQDIMNGCLGIAFTQGLLGESGVRIAEMVGPRLTAQDIQDINRHENLCILGVERMKGLTCLQGYSPIFVDWLMTSDKYEERKDRLSWPEEPGETLLLTSLWPEGNGETMVATPKSAEDELQEEAEIQEELNRLGDD